MPITNKGRIPIHIAYTGDSRFINGFCAVADVGDLLNGPLDYDEVMANATLIAAAPELLAALKAILEHATPRLVDGLREQAIAAIKKAEGGIQ